MSIDMAQFHQVFFEESFEGLDIMEKGLLNLDMGAVDVEEVNTIFRAAHSIKGGSGTFGFTDVSGFTHVMETLLDEMRDNRRQVTPAGVSVLLGSVDCLREMLTAIQNDEPVDEQNIAKHKQALDTELNGSESTAPLSQESEEGIVSVAQEQNDASESSQVGQQIEQIQDEKISGWNIAFSPHLDLLKTGSEPVRMFNELKRLGEMTVQVDFQGLPDFFDLDPEECHLSWSIQLQGDIAQEEIDEVFDWVSEDCDFAIRHLSSSDKPFKQDDSIEAVKDIVESVEIPKKQTDPLPIKQQTPELQTGEVKPEAEPTVKQIAKPQAEVKARQEAKPSTKSSSSIRVDTSKIDTLINMVGELVITQSMLSLVGENFDISKLDQLKNGLSQLSRHTRELQEGVMNIRMLPISFVFSRFPRLVYDLSSQLEKKIELELVGENTEVDKTVVELLSDPLVHLVRNSVDHGIELPADRVVAGKPETGIITLEAYHRGGNIVIEIRDDGKGLNREMLIEKAVEKGLISGEEILSDKQAFELVFMPGFSTAETLSDISGRGVGMDVVRKNIQALGGSIEIQSEIGKGSSFIIHLPLTLAILDGQSISVGDERYIIPLGSIIESVNVTENMLNRVSGKGETFRLRDEYLPIVRMHEIFNVTSTQVTEIHDGLVVVVDNQGVRCGLFIDDLLGQQQVVIKSLEENFRKVEGVSGATILGDGSVALILDIPGLVRLANQ